MFAVSELFVTEVPVEPPPSDELVRFVEAELGHHLPNSYVELARAHNGGVLARSVFPPRNRRAGPTITSR